MVLITHSGSITGTVTLPVAPIISDAGTVTQITNAFTSVTLNTSCGRITTFGASDGNFTVNNSLVTANSIILLTMDTLGTDVTLSGASQMAFVVWSVASGSFKIDYHSLTSNAVAFNFLVIN